MHTPRIPLPVRQWLYGLGIAAVPLLILYGAISAQEGAAWLAVLAAALGITPAATALAYARRSNPDGTPATTA